METLDKLLASQKDNPDPQQQAAHDLLKRTAIFAAQVKAIQPQPFAGIENRFQFLGRWSVRGKEEEIGTMALWADSPNQNETRVYYIVRCSGSQSPTLAMI